MKDNTPVLLKALIGNDFLPAQISGFRREYEALQSQDIPGLIHPIAFVDEDGRPLMVLEDFAGEPLEHWLNQHHLDVPTCLRLGSELVRIVAGLHAAHIIHCDIRPVNFMLDPQAKQLRLLDLSLAAMETSEVAMRDREMPGDWAYVSPEQTGRMNCPLDSRTDFYSLGITLYRMLTGTLPFTANDPLGWAHCHIARLPPAASEVAPTIPGAVSDIVMKLLAKLPEDRYQSAHGLQVDLERCLAQWQACGHIDPFPLGTEDVSDRFHIRHKLYGREQETATLLAAFGHMATTGEAALVTVSGYSGIGKSSLVHELHKPIVRARGYFIAGKFDQFMRDIPYATMTQAFRELVQQLLAESEERIAGWRQRIQDAVGINGQLIVELLPQVELLIGRQAPMQALAPAEARNRLHMVFQQFIAVFTKTAHPLVLFLDDVQWADAASLQLIEYLLIHPDTRYLLLIAAYRDNEVSTGHPLMTLLETIRRGNAAVIDIRLAPLAVAHLNKLVADTLHARPSSCESLTHLVFERTEGNPFFFTQFLGALHTEGLLRHDLKDRVWQWDLAHIKARDFADNVADLMVGKLRRLPAPVQETLQLAACLGNKFDLRHLALVSGLAEDVAGQCLSAAIREDVILRADGQGKFLHDRIQQAAYALIPEARRAEVHLHIGRTLIARLTAEEIDRHVFDIANQFNRGAALLSDPDEKARVAGIHLRAGRKAKASVAYASARGYLAAGMALFGDDAWESRYELLFGLWLECAECELLRSDFDTAERLIATLLRSANSKIDQAAAYRLKIELHLIKVENTQAIETARSCLRQFGIDLAAHPTPDQVRGAYEQVWRALGARPIESFIDLPLATDPEIRAAMDIIVALCSAAVFTDLNLFYLHICLLMNLSLRHGVTGASTWACGCFGVMLCSSFRRYAEGYRFSKLGCELVDKHGFNTYRAKACVTATLNASWTQPLNVTIELCRATIRAGGETGDLFYVCAAWCNMVPTLLLQGVPLDDVWRESETGLEFSRQVKHEHTVDGMVVFQRFIASLQGRTARLSSFDDAEAGPDVADGKSFDEAAFDEAAFEARLGEALPILACWYWLYKMQACSLAGDHTAALAAVRRAKALLWTLGGQAIPSLYYQYYAALVVAALYEGGSADEQREWRDVLLAHQAQLREWAQNYPPTFRDKFVLVSAEIARLEGRDLEAMRLYEQAIQSARENGFVQNEAIASELAAGFYLARGFAPAANGYLEQARDCYARWGAHGKVRQLEERYPRLRERSVRVLATQAEGESQLDMLSVTKASQAISGRIVLNEVIDTLMRIVIESAGAQTGALLLAHDDELTLAAEAHVEQQSVRVRLHRGLALPESVLPAAILNYVRRSQTQVLLADASEPHPFAADPYLTQRKPKSVLCLPIVRQSTLIGVLYLENTLVTHAFTPQRVTVLELLACQAAISLENARLYTDLQQENSVRKRVEETLRDREARIRRLVESNIIGIFFWDLHGGISDANDAFFHLIGYSRDDLLSKTIQWTDLTPMEWRAADARAMEELHHTGTFAPFETEYLRKDGTRIPILLGGALVEGSQEEGVAFVLDLTERKRAEQEGTARRAAEAANRAKSEFLANMSHELRTPLNGILGYAQILQRASTLDEQQRAGLNVIRHSGEHLLSLINDILDLAKIEAGKLELGRTDISLAEFLRVVADIIGVKAEQKKLDLVCDIAPDLPHSVRADEQRLRQILLNLLSNAVKFTDRGQVTLRVRFFPPVRLRFDVQDTGVGIGQEQLGNIFQPFEQVGELHRRVGGTGLGLAISRQFVRLMGGEIQVQSQVGQGSTFWFELELPVVKAGRPARPPDRMVSGYGGARKKVLVVDDLAENRALLIDMLGQIGFDMAAAANGREGLEKARTLRPDLILMDIAMPEVDGLETTRRLRQLPGLQEVPIIAISANASGSNEQACLAAGGNAFLPKPIDLDKLLTQIAILLKLDWTYEVLRAGTAAGQGAAGPLLAPPAQEMEDLHRLARLGNMQAIVRWASQLGERDEQYRPFANQLRDLAEGYQSKAILNLVECYLAAGT